MNKPPFQGYLGKFKTPGSVASPHPDPAIARLRSGGSPPHPPMKPGGHVRSGVTRNDPPSLTAARLQSGVSVSSGDLMIGSMVCRPRIAKLRRAIEVTGDLNVSI